MIDIINKITIEIQFNQLLLIHYIYTYTQIYIYMSIYLYVSNGSIIIMH
jgi:hypothetical protein